MAHLRTRLNGLSVVVIDTADIGKKIMEAFASAGAKVTLLTDQDADILDHMMVPDIVVLDPETIGDRRLRAFAFRLVSEEACVSIIYGDTFPDNHYSSEDMIHKSRSIEDVVETAARSLRGI